MCGLLALLFIAVPALEIFVLIEVGNQIGALATLGIIVATGVLGAALARHQGLSAVREIQRSFATGTHVGRSVAEALLVLCASVMLLTPGFFTDAFGFAMLVPPMRRIVAGWLVVRFAGRAQRMTIGSMPGMPGGMSSGFGWSVEPGRRPADDANDADGVGEGGPRGSADEPDDYEPPPPGVIDV